MSYLFYNIKYRRASKLIYPLLCCMFKLILDFLLFIIIHEKFTREIREDKSHNKVLVRHKSTYINMLINN